ncbi:MAG: family 43 glycosylhydrolase [Planctomycetota bacterium]|nr:MAG: family 43 glycosylhydrolase [Planctomycetota bacterium]
MPGVLWYDTSSNVLSSHGGGILKEGNTYYWFGEYMDSDPNNVLPVYEGHVTHQFVANTCYSSIDFVHWTFENNVLTQQASGDLGPGRVVERPKVIYNDLTGQYVMYMHIDSSMYDDNRVGVATCPTVNGNYTYLGGFWPLGNRSGDMTLFKDDDGKGYLLSNNGLSGINIYELTDDYLDVNSLATLVRKPGAEAPAMFKAGGTYYLLCSDSSWWTPNDNFYFTATSITGRWSTSKDFTPDSTNTWASQTTYVQPIQGSVSTTYVFMADRWNEWDFGNSMYIFLPLIVDGTTLTVDWYDEWTLDAETGEWAPVECTASTIHVESIVCSTVPIPRSQGMSYGEVTVTIYDDCGDRVVGAEVTGTFTGDFNETLTETTDDSGVVVLTTTTGFKQPSYTFCVDNVSHATLSYDPNDNTETCESY